MSEKLYKVYIHTNKINGKKYVGITCRDVNLRWQYGKGYINNEHFYRAICKYGWDNFSHEIIADGLSKDDACDMEIALIAQLKTQDCNFGYNITAGGEHANVTEATKQKISKANTGRVVTKETRDKLSKLRLGKPSKLAGRKLSDEHKQKIGESLIGHKHSDESIEKMRANASCNISVECDGNVFKSISDCAKYYDVSLTLIAAWLRGERNMPEKFVKMKLHYNNTEYSYEKIQSENSKVLCDDIIYDNITDCANQYNINRSTMSKWLNGTNNMPQKFIDMKLQFIPTFTYKLKTIKELN